jgi:ubiquinone/menaquinone biosynthesis C-methylase UbiE
LKENYSICSEKLIQRINELCHDLTKDQYQESHPEIFEQEKERWERIAKQFFDSTNPKTIVDVGTGTGFVPITTAKFLGKEDTFICSDISGGILSVAMQNIAKQNFSCQFKFVKIESQVPFRLPLETESIDMLTVNSVLHHIKETSAFLNELDRVLKSDGLLFIAHEPNKCFFENWFLRYNYVFLNSMSLTNLKLTAHIMLKKMYLERLAKRTYYFVYPKRKEHAEEYEKLTNRLNKLLLEEGLIQKPLSPEEIVRAVEIRELEGFRPNSLFPGYKLLHFETYNHIASVTTRNYSNTVVRKYNNLLSRKYPQSGALFFIVLKKSVN